MVIDLLAILRKNLDPAIFLYTFIREVRLNGVRASIAICIFENSTKRNEISFDAHSFFRIAKRSIVSFKPKIPETYHACCSLSESN